MRRVSARLKPVAVAITAFIVLVSVGCSSGPADDTAVKSGSGVSMNPGGQAQTPEQAAYAANMQKVGATMNAQQQKDAAAMAAARAGTAPK